MKIKLSQHAKARLLQRFNYLGLKKLKSFSFEHKKSIGNNLRLYYIPEIKAYFYWNRNSKKIITFLTEDMIQGD